MDDDDCDPCVSHHPMVEPFEVSFGVGSLFLNVLFFTCLVLLLTRNVSTDENFSQKRKVNGRVVPRRNSAA